MAARRTTPKYARLSSQIRRMIRSRRLAVGDALPTELDLAEDFKCSRGTVRKALDILVNEGMVRRRQGSGHFVARLLDTAREALLGLVVPNILNAEVLRLAQLLTLESGARGYRLVLCVTNEEPAFEREFLREMRRLKVSGVIKFPTIPEAPGFETEIRELLRSLELPYVIVNDFWTDTRRDHHVAFDEATGLELAVAHLLEIGHRSIGWVDGSDGPRRHALACLRATLRREGLDVPDDRVLLCPPYDSPPVERLWREADDPPTALITPYDGIAVRLIEALQRMGMRVPEDVSIATLNGQPFYTTSGQELTTAIPPNEQIVGTVLDILTDASQDAAVRQCLFRPGFHVGRTSSAPRPARERAPVGSAGAANN